MQYYCIYEEATLGKPVDIPHVSDRCTTDTRLSSVTPRDSRQPARQRLKFKAIKLTLKISQRQRDALNLFVKNPTSKSITPNKKYPYIQQFAFLCAHRLSESANGEGDRVHDGLCPITHIRIRASLMTESGHRAVPRNEIHIIAKRE